VIEHVGATPVLADVEADTLNIDPVQIEKAITPATRAIIAVHYAGHPVELNAVRDIAARHHLHLIEDAAHAVGAEFHGEPIGSRDNFTAFSFYATKNLTTGEGGMLTGNQELLDRARIVSLHGMNREAWSRYAAGGKWAYDIVEPGFKYNMTDIQAALGLQQLRRFTWMQERRAHIVNQYNQAFQSAAFITPVTRNFVRNAHHLYVLRIREGELSIDRNQFIDEMTARNIGTSVHFIPIHMHSWYRNKYGYTPDSFPVAHRAFQQMLSLPLSPSMSDQDVSDVIDAVLDIRTKFARRRMAA
jgi:dTDP-4-amino-4,6-dideoxygalactose transaminase